MLTSATIGVHSRRCFLVEPTQDFKINLAEDFVQIRTWIGDEDFCSHVADLNSALTHVTTRTGLAAKEMETVQKATIEQAKNDLGNLPDWSELTDAEQRQCWTQVDELAIEAGENLAGLKKRISQDYVIGTRVNEIKRSIAQTGNERRSERIEQEREQAK